MTPSSTTAIDPVCGMQVDIGTTFLTAKHRDKVYYFCSAGCQTAFQTTPQRYLDPDDKPPRFGAMVDRACELFHWRQA